jgi:hypothetical protein
MQIRILRTKRDLGGHSYIQLVAQAFEDKKERVVNTAPGTFKDHYAINLNRGWIKLQNYYIKFDDSPV